MDNNSAFALYEQCGYVYKGDVKNVAGDGRIVVERVSTNQPNDKNILFFSFSFFVFFCICYYVVSFKPLLIGYVSCP